MATCSVADCARPAIARTLCTMHYQRAMRWGDPNVRGHVGRYARPMADRFWERVAVEDADMCWEWTGGRTSSKWVNYGKFTDEDGKTVMAHRYSWLIHYGPIPDGMFVLHHCDNPICVNPAHLFLGTHEDNMRDMVAKERQSRPAGSSHYRTALTESDVLAIRSDTRPRAEIAKQYGLTTKNVGKIQRHDSWKHV